MFWKHPFRLRRRSLAVTTLLWGGNRKEWLSFERKKKLYRNRADDLIMRAGKEMGWAQKECMNYENDCIELSQMTIRDGRRCSTSTAFLEQAHARENVHILSDTYVTQVLIKGNAAGGVKFRKGGKIYSVNVDKEVILSLGAIDSPKSFMLSGVGPRDHLESLGIDVKVDLPVGNNLQDHCYASMPLKVDNGTVTVEDLEDSMDEYVKNQTGPLSTDGIPIMGYSTLDKSGSLGTPVIQHLFGTMADSKEHWIQISTTVMRPKSKGMVRLRSVDTEAMPLIDSNVNSHEADAKTTHAGVMEGITFMKTDSIIPLNARLTPHDPCNETEPIEVFVTCNMHSYGLHPISTVKMAPKNKEGVVDNRLKVYGIDKLRVIDASIAPSVVSVNTNTMSIVVGSDIIRGL